MRANLGAAGGCSCAGRVFRLNIFVDQFSERGGKFVVISVQGDGFFAVDEEAFVLTSPFIERDYR